MHANQFSYDNAAEPESDDYRESQGFAEFAEYVVLELLAGRDCQGLSSEILMIDLECFGGGYQMAIEWVSARLTERQYRGWIDDCGYELN